MFYIHQHTCISPQQTFGNTDLNQLLPSVDNTLRVLEPGYDGIPPAILRRMGKAVRIGVGAALPIARSLEIHGVILGTANGGMEDCIKFLDQIIEYQEGMLTPGNFVQSTPNAIAGQLGLLTRNKGYNITHVHRGLAFENALLDAAMLTREHPGKSFLVGGVDEISQYNYNIDYLAGWFKKEPFSSNELYTVVSDGTLAGEGTAMFVVNDSSMGATARLKDVATVHTEDEKLIEAALRRFLAKNLQPGEKIDLLVSGENGDKRLQKYYTASEAEMPEDCPVARFKHMTGEFATAAAVGLWLSCQVLDRQVVPAHMIKKNSFAVELRNILLYNNYKGAQHSFMLVSKP